MIRQGDIYWIEFREPTGSEPAYTRPCIVIQNDVVNESPIETVIVCPLTTHLEWQQARGNVLLKKAETRLPQHSVALVPQVTTVNKKDFQDDNYVGHISRQRVQQVIKGINHHLEPRDVR